MPAKARICLALSGLSLALACEDPPAEIQPTPAKPAESHAPTFVTEKVDLSKKAMGTEIRMIAYTTPKLDATAVNKAMEAALAEIRRLEALMTSWRDDSEVAKINQQAGSWVAVSPETFEVLEKSVWAGKISEGTFDITFQSMSGLWKFGDAAEKSPQLPSAADVAKAKRHIDYRKIELTPEKREVRIGKEQAIGLGGIAKGYAVDRAAASLKEAGVESFLMQAGGDLYGAGRKPDGSPWVSGIRDPRGPADRFFATIELTDHAFSTAGDYARSYILNGKRYHHIIDPRSGYPADRSRSVTVWAKDALTADAVDDALFILGPEKGLALLETLDGVGAVIVDAKNQVHVSRRIKDKVRILSQPTDGP